MSNFEWEFLDGDHDTMTFDTYRAKVHDGWVVRERYYDSVSITFVRDPHYLWRIDRERH